jgi:hypothetical protein
MTGLEPAAERLGSGQGQGVKFPVADPVAEGGPLARCEAQGGVAVGGADLRARGAVGDGDRAVPAGCAGERLVEEQRPLRGGESEDGAGAVVLRVAEQDAAPDGAASTQFWPLPLWLDVRQGATSTQLWPLPV